jgi:HEAT repeats
MDRDNLIDSGAWGREEILLPIPSPWMTKITAGSQEEHKRHINARDQGNSGNPDAVPALLTSLQEENFFVQRESALALGEIGDTREMEPILAFLKNYNDNYFKEALGNIKGKLIYEDHSYFFMKCLHGCEMYSISLPPLETINFYAFRKCHSNSYIEKEVHNNTLSLNHKMVQPFTFKNNHMVINWYQLGELPDFDNIMIVDAGEHEIEEMVMKLWNDNGGKRRESFSTISVQVVPDLEISKVKKNLLRETLTF